MTIDVALRFRFFFETGFFLASAQFVIGVFVLFVHHKENWVKTLLTFTFKTLNILVIILWIYGFSVRYMHSGCECSGDFIVTKTKAKNLLIVEGMFLKFTSLLVAFILVLFSMGNVINCFNRITGGTEIEISFDI